MTSDASSRRTAILVAALFLVTAMGAIAGTVLLNSVVNAPDYLTRAYPKSATMTSGVILWLVNDIGIVFIGLLMFPILKRQDEHMALGYVAMRMLECMFLIVGVIFAMLLVPLSQEFIKGTARDVAWYQAAGALLKQAEYWFMIPMQFVFLGLGGIILTSLLYRSKLVPRFISVVGLVGYVLLLPAALLAMFGILDPSFGAPGAAVAIPVGIFEIILMPIWLFTKGFNTPVVSSKRGVDPGRMGLQPAIP